MMMLASLSIYYFWSFIGFHCEKNSLYPNLFTITYLVFLWKYFENIHAIQNTQAIMHSSFFVTSWCLRKKCLQLQDLGLIIFFLSMFLLRKWQRNKDLSTSLHDPRAQNKKNPWEDVLIIFQRRSYVTRKYWWLSLLFFVFHKMDKCLVFPVFFTLLVIFRSIGQREGWIMFLLKEQANKY